MKISKKFWKKVLKEYEVGLLEKPDEVYLCSQSPTFEKVYKALSGGNKEIMSCADKFLVENPEYSFYGYSSVLFIPNDIDETLAERRKVREEFLKWCIKNEN